MKKQTAVEWLHEQLTSTWYDGKSSNLLLEVAKDMEKDQISMAHLEGAMKMHHKQYKSGDQYYEENYGKK